MQSSLQKMIVIFSPGKTKFPIMNMKNGKRSKKKNIPVLSGYIRNFFQKWQIFIWRHNENNPEGYRKIKTSC